MTQRGVLDIGYGGGKERAAEAEAEEEGTRTAGGQQPLAPHAERMASGADLYPGVQGLQRNLFPDTPIPGTQALALAQAEAEAHHHHGRIAAHSLSHLPLPY